METLRRSVLISLPGMGAGRRGLHSLMWQKRRAHRAWTMVVTAVFVPITRIWADSFSGLGGMGVVCWGVEESLNIEVYLVVLIVTIIQECC